MKNGKHHHKVYMQNVKDQHQVDMTKSNTQTQGEQEHMKNKPTPGGESKWKINTRWTGPI